MGYTKYVQYGDYTDVYRYEKRVSEVPRYLRRRRHESAIQKKRRKERRRTHVRSSDSIHRSRINFFRMVHHNNTLANSIHFLTLTFAHDLTYKQATRYLSEFIRQIKKHHGEVPFNYVSVSELTKKGRYHFHLLVYDLPSTIAGDPISIWSYNRRKRSYEWQYFTTERFTRNLQRLFRRGYLEISPTSYTSEGLAGYMAKYMGKSLHDTKTGVQRGYNCSRGLERPTSAGGNSLSGYTDLILTEEDLLQEEREYDTVWLGKCQLLRYKNKNLKKYVRMHKHAHTDV